MRKDHRLYNSAERGQIRRVENLLERGADPNCMSRGALYKDTVLHIAVRNGQKDVVKKLIAAGGEVNKQIVGNRSEFSFECEAALHLASREGHGSVVDVLLLADADVNLETDIGWTPLHYAVVEGHKGIVDTLLRAGAKPDPPADRAGRTLLYLAVHRRGNEEVVKALLAAGAKVRQQKWLDWSGQAALQDAVRLGDEDAAEALLAAQADPDGSDKNIMTPLGMAKEHLESRVGTLEPSMIELLKEYIVAEA